MAAPLHSRTTQPAIQSVSSLSVCLYAGICGLTGVVYTAIVVFRNSCAGCGDGGGWVRMGTGEVGGAGVVTVVAG